MHDAEPQHGASNTSADWRVVVDDDDDDDDDADDDDDDDELYIVKIT